LRQKSNRKEEDEKLKVINTSSLSFFICNFNFAPDFHHSKNDKKGLKPV
jgi:hypothetical protein